MRGLRLAAAWCGAVAWRVVGEARDLGAPSGCRSPGASYRTVKLWRYVVADGLALAWTGHGHGARCWQVPRAATSTSLDPASTFDPAERCLVV